jgi:hypothetical protein
VGRLSRQVKLLHNATSPRIIPGVVHLSAKGAREPKRTSEPQKKAMESSTDLYEPIISTLGITGHVNLLLDAKSNI